MQESTSSTYLSFAKEMINELGNEKALSMILAHICETVEE